MLSNLANTAMLCCMDMKQHASSSEAPTCHDKSKSDSQGEIDIQDMEQSCDCDSCFQKNTVQAIGFDSSLSKSNLYSAYLSALVTLDPSLLYLPPKLNS